MAINQMIEQTQSNPQCDAAIKKLFGDPYIISTLIKLSFPEIYDSYSIQEIRNQYVIDEINIGDIPVDQDEILKLNSEDSSKDESLVRYDVLTLLKTPGSNQGLFLDIEGQNNYHPGYDLINRGIYYIGRLISRQKNLIWFQSNYDGLLKAISVWICTNPTKNAENTIQCIELNYRNVVGTLKKKKEIYDKAEILMIQLGKDAYQQENKLLQFLGTLMTSQLSAKEKLDYLKNEFQIEDEETKRTVNGMCNLSTGYYNEGFSEGKASGFNEGKASGFSEGKELGMRESTYQNIQRMKVHLHITDQEAMDVLEIPENERHYYLTKN